MLTVLFFVQRAASCWEKHRGPLTLEAALKFSIGFKIKAGAGGQPQTYRSYFEDWLHDPNADIELEGMF